MIIDEYWSGVARRLSIEARAMNSLIPHQGEKGRSNEIAISRVLENLLPPNVGVGTGVTFDHEGRTSPQMDIVLFDKNSQPQLLAQTTQLMFPIETVLACIEIKTTLTASDVEDFAKKSDKYAQLPTTSAELLPPFCLFAFQFGGSDYQRAVELEDLAGNRRPALACVIEPGFVMGEAAGGDVGFTPLHTRDASGRRIGGDWMVPTAQGTVAEIVDGVTYPVFMMGQYHGDRYIGDPGRALLVFCALLLEKMDADGRSSWLGRYVTGNLREVQPLMRAKTN